MYKYILICIVFVLGVAQATSNSPPIMKDPGSEDNHGNNRNKIGSGNFHDSGSGGGNSNSGSSSQRRGPFCHGALGMQCGEILQGQIASCFPLGGNSVACQINGGSWRHDECCEEQPANNPGAYCAGGGERSRSCLSSWDKAVSHLWSGHSWWRIVDKTRADTTPLKIDKAHMCGKKDAKIHVADDDGTVCCSGKSRNLNVFEAVFDSKGRRCL